MAEQPPGMGSSPPLLHEDSDLLSLGEVASMKEKFLKNLREIQSGRGKMEEDRVEGDGEIDTDEEYQKEMEEERLADIKNGHLVDDFIPPLSTKPSPRRKNSQAAAQNPAAAVRVASKVAAFESLSSPRVSGDSLRDVGEKERGNKECIAALLQPSLALFEKDQPINAPSLDESDIDMGAAVLGEEKCVSFYSKIGSNMVDVDGCDKSGTESINEALHAKQIQPMGEKECLMQPT